MSQSPKIHFFLWCFACLLCVATFALIFFGGQVKSHEAGLAVPDWPLTYGQNPITYPIDKWTGNIFHEHFHRLWAGSVATLTLLLALFLSCWSPRRWVTVVGWAAVGAVLVQAMLGGLTVWYKLPWYISASHGSLAQTFFIVTIILAYGLYGSWRRGDHRDHPPAGARTPLFAAALILIALIYGQLFLGAVMRHTESGLAIPDFPTVGGQWLPRFNESMLETINDWRFYNVDALDMELPAATLGQVVIHFAHRLGGLIVFLAVGGLMWSMLRQRREHPHLFRVAGFMWVLVLLQVSLGVLTVWTAKSPIITSLHVAGGAALLGATVFFALRAWHTRLPAESQGGAAPQQKPPRRQRRHDPAAALERSPLQAYYELTKPRIVTMVLVTTILGYAMGRGGILPLWLLVHTLVGTAMAAGGASVLNQVLERDLDARMARTRYRPLPLGQVGYVPAMLFGVALVLGGYGYLLVTANLVAALLSFASAALYVLVYTPLKRFSWVNTTVGAVPGAIPPLIGWAAATGGLHLGAWVLFGILFLWQHPHFYSIAWMFREDYARGRLKMLPVVKPDGASTFRHSLGFAILLVPVSLLPTFVRLVSWPYFVGAMLAGLWFLFVCARWRMSRTNFDARRVLLASIIYLPLLLAFFLVDALIS
ncbi:MAG: heme o synthase [Candidatus Hydrogenedentota bacterium]